MLTLITWCQSSSVCSQMGAARPASPALLTRISSEPAVAITFSMAAVACSVRVTSRHTAKAPPPMRFAAAFASSRSISATATRAPAAVRRCAIASPIPVAAPVTRAVCPVNSNIPLSCFGSCDRRCRDSTAGSSITWSTVESLPQRMKRGIDFSPAFVAGFVSGSFCCIGLDALRHFDRLAAGLVEIGPVTRAHAGHERAAESAAFFSGEHFHCLAVDAGLDAPPQCAARAAPAQADTAHGNAKLGKEGERVLKRVGHALERCASKVRGAVLHAYAGKGRAHFGVEMRRALAKKIRRPREAFAAGRDLRCGFTECVVVLACEKCVAQPAQTQAGGLRDAHHVPQAGHGMAKSVQAAFGVFGWLGGCGEHHTRGANGGRNAAGLQNAHADRARALVARARGDWSAGLEPCCRGSGVADARADLGRLEDAWQPALADSRCFGHFARPAAMRDIEQQRARGLLHIDRELSRKPVAYIVLGAHHVANFREDFRLMGLDPQQLGECEVGQRGIAGELDQPLVADLLREPVAL